MRVRLCILLLAGIAALQGSRAGNREVYPLPEERGTAGILARLEALPISVRVLQITAHPDDESAGTLTWLSRKFHARTALFCLTRGEGGQNILGSEKYEELGLVRTGELLEASRYYGIDLFFGKAFDFGFSKTGEETLSKWGRESTLEDMVRLIRLWRPDIVLSRFQGNAADGHGHHQATGVLTVEAFRAASDPDRFPRQIEEGLRAWRPNKLYVSSGGGEFTPAREGSAPWTVRVPVGQYDPVLGRSYREIGSEGYSKHRSQGIGATASTPGRSFEYFRLVDSAVGIPAKEDNFFDGIDSSLLSIGGLVSGEREKVPFLQDDLARTRQFAADALNLFQAAHPEKSSPALAQGSRLISDIIRKVEQSALSSAAKSILREALSEKLGDFQEAMNAVLGIRLVARAQDLAAVPGETEPVNLTLHNQGPENVIISGMQVSIRQNKSTVLRPKDNLEGRPLLGGGSLNTTLSLELSPNAEATEPFWRLTDGAGARYSIRPTHNEFAPFDDPEFRAEARYRFQETEFPVYASVKASAGDPIRGADFTDFQIVPALSVTMNPGIVLAPVAAGKRTQEFQVSVLNNRKSGATGTLKLLSPPGWHVEPAEAPFELARKGETVTAKFLVHIPGDAATGHYAIQAIAIMEGKEYRRGHNTISYPENWTRNFYAPAQSLVERFDVQVAPGLMVGYVPGAGDDVPAALEQLGIKVQVLSEADLAYGDLHRYSAIITGIRAYNVNGDLRAHNRRLLEYVSQGGTLIVQYVRPMERAAGGGGGAFLYGPYPMSVSNSERITVEDSPVRILEPGHPLFHQPNRITAADFEGWVQERGLYFMASWDSRYSPLFSGNDPGEDPKAGGMLYASYGKGHYVYTGYAWFRQLPAGVPGAYRVFANMLSLGVNAPPAK